MCLCPLIGSEPLHPFPHIHFVQLASDLWRFSIQGTATKVIVMHKYSAVMQPSFNTNLALYMPCLGNIIKGRRWMEWMQQLHMRKEMRRSVVHMQKAVYLHWTCPTCIYKLAIFSCQFIKPRYSTIRYVVVYTSCTSKHKHAMLQTETMPLHYTHIPIPII